MRNVRFLWPGTEASVATQPFNPEFLRRLAPFSTLRFMDWGAVNHSPLVRWADRPQPGDAVYTSDRGVPVERMIDLANVLQADPWFCIPHQADDDYVRQFATLVKARLDPRRVASIEYSNEVWNGAFGQARYAVAQARALGLPTPAGLGSIWYAERTRQIVAIVDAVFGRRRAQALARDRGRAGGLEPVRQRCARLEGHRRARRRLFDRAVLQRRRSQRPGQDVDGDARADAGRRSSSRCARTSAAT